ncbi:MAG TPA: CBS domain-containing protein, partial [Stellaceae bacterium]|nr:CBS domain-containing protein [Stellaceae bacterium]
AMQVAAEGLDPGKTTVGQAMSSDVLYCFESESVEEVSEKMRGWWVRRLPVVSRDKRLIGTVSLGDLTSLKGQPKTKPKSRRAPSRYGRKSRAILRAPAAA